MLTLPPSVRIFVATCPCDLRKSFDGLSVLVESVLRHDPLSGHLFCFYNRRGNQVRVLYWDRSGWCLFAKRLAQGRFRFVDLVRPGVTHVEVSRIDLTLVLEGIDLPSVRRHRRLDLRAAISPTTV